MRITALFRFGPLDGCRLTLPDDALEVIDLTALHPVCYVRGRVDDRTGIRHYYSPEGLDEVLASRAGRLPLKLPERKVSNKLPWKRLW
jgi:hypothetical protein